MDTATTRKRKRWNKTNGMQMLSNKCFETVAVEILRACQTLKLGEGRFAESMKAMDEIESNTLNLLPKPLSVALERLLLKSIYEQTHATEYFVFCLRKIRFLRYCNLDFDFNRIRDPLASCRLLSENIPQVTSFTLFFNDCKEEKIDHFTFPSGFKNLKTIDLILGKNTTNVDYIDKKVWDKIWHRLICNFVNMKKENIDLLSITIHACKRISDETFKQFLKTIFVMDSLRNLHIHMPLTSNQLLRLYDNCPMFLKCAKVHSSTTEWYWNFKSLYEKNIVLTEIEKTAVRVDSVQNLLDCFRIISTTCPNLISLTILFRNIAPNAKLDCIVKNLSQFNCLCRLTLRNLNCFLIRDLLPISFCDRKIKYLSLHYFRSKITTILSIFENLEVLNVDHGTVIDYANMQRPLKYIIHQNLWTSCNIILMRIVRNVLHTYMHDFRRRAEVVTFGFNCWIIMNRGTTTIYKPSIVRTFPFMLRLRNLEKNCIYETGNSVPPKLRARIFEYSGMSYSLIKKLCQYDLPFNIGRFEEPSEYIARYLDLRESRNLSFPDPPASFYKCANDFFMQ